MLQLKNNDYLEMSSMKNFYFFDNFITFEKNIIKIRNIFPKMTKEPLNKEDSSHIYFNSNISTHLLMFFMNAEII